MSDLRSPMEDRPYRPADRAATHPVRDDEAMGMTEYYRSRLESIRQSRWFPLASVFAAVLVFSGVISYAYKQGAQSGVNATTPIVEAADTAYKEKPANPGGMDVPFQDAIVFDQLQGGNSAAAGDTIESLLPPPEQPIATAIAPENTTGTESTIETALNNTANNTADAPQQPVAETMTIASGTTSPEPEKTGSSTTVPQIPQKPVNTIPTVTAQDTKQDANQNTNALASTMDKVAPAAASATQALASGDYRIQLGAFRDEAAARSAWDKFRKEFGGALAGVTPDFPRADLGAKGVFYRVQGKNLSKSAADSVCASLNASRSGSCMVVR